MCLCTSLLTSSISVYINLYANHLCNKVNFNWFILSDQKNNNYNTIKQNGILNNKIFKARTAKENPIWKHDNYNMIVRAYLRVPYTIIVKGQAIFVVKVLEMIKLLSLVNIYLSNRIWLNVFKSKFLLIFVLWNRNYSSSIYDARPYTLVIRVDFTIILIIYIATFQDNVRSKPERMYNKIVKTKI